ncbi:hypothetical protein [Nitratifractor sp.]
MKKKKITYECLGNGTIRSFIVEVKEEKRSLPDERQQYYGFWKERSRRFPVSPGIAS